MSPDGRRIYYRTPFGGGFNGEYSAAYKPPARWGPYARGRRLRHQQTRPYETRPCLSWKQPHAMKGRATLMQHIGVRIREYRMLHGLTQEALAEKAGMHPNTIKKLELGGTARMYTL